MRLPKPGHFLVYRQWYESKFGQMLRCIVLSEIKLCNISPHCISELVVTFDAKLSYIPYIDNISSSAYKTLGFIISITKGLVKFCMMLFNSLVPSKLEYALVV